MTGIHPLQGTSQEPVYHKLDLDSLGDQRRYRKLTVFYKVVNGLAPKCLTNYLNTNVQNKSIKT